MSLKNIFKTKKIKTKILPKLFALAVVISLVGIFAPTVSEAATPGVGHAISNTDLCKS